MTFDTYLASPGAKSLTSISLEIGVSKGRLSQLRHSTDWPPEIAMKVERATGNYLSASDLSPVVAQARKRAKA